MAELIEPEDLRFVRTGKSWPWRFWYRDDATARSTYGKDDDFDPERRWWDCADEYAQDGPSRWDEVADQPDPQLVSAFATIKGGPR